MRELVWHLARRLLVPCSVLEQDDTAVLNQLSSTLASCRPEHVAVLRAAFFSTPQARSALADAQLARLIVLNR